MKSTYVGLLLSSILCFPVCHNPALADQSTAVAIWTFNGTLNDSTGHGHDLYSKDARFAAGHNGQGLITGSEPIPVPDSADLRLVPGLRIECWIKFETQPTNGAQILMKEGEYLLRVEPATDGGRISFFVKLDGWEPRIQSKDAPLPGVWYHLVAGWDGKEISLAVNKDEVRRPRTGIPAPHEESLRIGPMDAVIDDLRIENPAAKKAGVAHWSFDGSLNDDSGKGHDIAASGAHFVPGRSGQALQSGSQLLVTNSPDLQLAPGLRIDCSVFFEQLPVEGRCIVIKDGEYQLRLESQKDGGHFSFFVNLDGGWEPRTASDEPAKTGVWYHIIAKWDGTMVTLDLNGEKTSAFHSGLAKPGDKPLHIGTLGGLIDDLRIENPHLPVLRIQALTQEQAILRAGRPEKIRAIIQNVGGDVDNTIVSLELPSPVICRDGTVQKLGVIPSGITTNVEWTVQADTPMSVVAGVNLVAGPCKPPTTHRVLAFFPADEQPALPVATNITLPPGGPAAVTYYIDSVGGSNSGSGTAPATPWRDFTNINGKRLGPGDKLLIKRGSIINQELNISASGTSNNWAEIGAYGTGPRPVISRNWDIDDRCALVHDPDFLLIRSLVVCYAAKGLVVHYRKKGNSGLIIEDCIAHHIEGLYRQNANGIPEWRDRNGSDDDGLRSSAGIAIVGAHAKDLVLRNCEMFQASWGFFVTGDAVTIDRVFCHDNYVHNTSPHPALISPRRSFLQNSIFDAPGGHAYAGTMGIMLCDPEGLIIRNCTFRNQPDSGSHDEGGIDFENSGNGCLIDHCTFQNNAGAAIEVLGLKMPQPRNVEIRNSQFIRNNVARKLGPSEIYIWGQQRSPDVCCSTGTIHDNGYVTNPGIEFFTNEAPLTTAWTLRDNRGYATVEELEKAMPFNKPPAVNAGPDIRTDSRTVPLSGRVSDDGRPGSSQLITRWEMLEGPGTVIFHDTGKPETTADISVPGDYLLRLVGDDGELWRSDMVVVHVLPAGASVTAAWEFNTTLNKEGWTEVNPGTSRQEWKNQKWPCVSEPVKYVSGGFYILAVENSPNAHLLSPDNLGIDLTANKAIKIRFQNHTPATTMKFKFITDADTVWNDDKSRSFAVAANDNVPREYTINMSTGAGWTGHLRQLRLEIATGTPVTGTCRFDYIWIGNGY